MRLSIIGLVIALLTLALGTAAYFDQRSQIDALRRTTPTGRMLPFATDGKISHESTPINIIIEAQNVPVAGRLWIVNHKHSLRGEKLPDHYYPTEVELQSDGLLVASSVFIGNQADARTITYDLGLYFCDSVDSRDIQSFLNSDKRSEGLEVLSGPSCKQLDAIRVTRAGDS